MSRQQIESLDSKITFTKKSIERILEQMNEKLNDTSETPKTLEMLNRTLTIRIDRLTELTKEKVTLEFQMARDAESVAA